MAMDQVIKHGLELAIGWDDKSQKRMRNAVRNVFTEEAHIDFANPENIQGLKVLGEMMRKIFTQAGDKKFDFEKIMGAKDASQMFAGLKDAAMEFDRVWESLVANMGSFSFKDMFMRDASELSTALQRITDKNGKIIKANIRDIQRAFEEVTTLDQNKLFGNLLSAEKAIKGARTWETRTAAALEYVNIYEKILKLTDGDVTALDVDQKYMKYAERSLNKNNKVAGIYPVEALREALPQMQTSLQNIFNMAMGKALVGLTDGGIIDINVSPVVIKKLDLGDLFNKKIGDGAIGVPIVPQIDPSFKSKLEKLRDLYTKGEYDDAAYNEFEKLQQEMVESLPEAMREAALDRLYKFADPRQLKNVTDRSYNAVYKDFVKYGMPTDGIGGGTGTGDGAGAGTGGVEFISEDDVRLAEEAYDRLSAKLDNLRNETIEAEKELERLQKRASVYGFGSDKTPAQEGRIQSILAKNNRSQYVVDMLKKGYQTTKTPSGEYGFDRPDLGKGVYTKITKTEYEYAEYLSQKVKELNVDWDEGLKILQSQNGQLEAAKARVEALRSEEAKTAQEVEAAYEAQARAHSLRNKQQSGGTGTGTGGDNRTEEDVENANKLAEAIQRVEAAYKELDALNADPWEIKNEEEVNRILQERLAIIQRVGEENLRAYNPDAYSEVEYVNDQYDRVLDSIAESKDDAIYDNLDENFGYYNDIIESSQTLEVLLAKRRELMQGITFDAEQEYLEQEEINKAIEHRIALMKQYEPLVANGSITQDQLEEMVFEQGTLDERRNILEGLLTDQFGNEPEDIDEAQALFDQYEKILVETGSGKKLTLGPEMSEEDWNKFTKCNIDAIKSIEFVRKEMQQISQDAQQQAEVQVQANDAEIESNKEKIKSYEELSAAVSRYIELAKTLVSAENNTKEHQQIKADMDFADTFEMYDEKDYIDAINKWQKNISKIKSAIKGGASSYTDEDGYEYNIVEDTLKEAESKLRGYIYHYAENFDDIGTLIDGAKTKGLQNIINKEVGKFKADEGIQKQQEEIAEATNAAALAEMERIEDLIEGSAPTEKFNKVFDALSELKYRAHKVDRYTQSSVTDDLASDIGITSPHKEIENNAQAIKSYEELCSIVARYNELRQKRYIYSGDEYPTLSEDEENEFAELTGRLNATRNGVKITYREVEGDINKLAQLLGITVPQAAQQAETAVGGLNNELAETGNRANDIGEQTTGSVPDTGSGQTDGATSDEVKNINDVRDAVAKVTAEVKEKTQEFLNEQTAVKKAAQSEVHALGEVEKKVNAIRVALSNVNVLLNNIKKGKDIGSGLSNININVNHKKDDGKKQPETSWALEDTLRDKTNGLLGKIVTNTDAIKTNTKDVAKDATLKKVLNAINTTSKVKFSQPVQTPVNQPVAKPVITKAGGNLLKMYERLGALGVQKNALDVNSDERKGIQEKIRLLKEEINQKRKLVTVDKQLIAEAQKKGAADQRAQMMTVGGRKSDLQAAKDEKKAIDDLLEAYKRLGALRAKRDLLPKGAERDALQKEIKLETSRLWKKSKRLGVDSAKTSEASALGEHDVQVDQLIEKTKLLGKYEKDILSMEKGSESHNNAQKRINELNSEIALIRKKITLTQEEKLELNALVKKNNELVNEKLLGQADKERSVHNAQVEAEVVKELIKLYEQLGRAQATGNKDEASRLRGVISTERGKLSSVDYATDMKFKDVKSKGFESARTRAEKETFKSQEEIIKRLNKLYQEYGVLVERAGAASGHFGEQLKTEVLAKATEIQNLRDSMDFITPEMFEGFDEAFDRGRQIESTKQYEALAKKSDADEATRLKNIASLQKEIGELEAKRDAQSSQSVTASINEEIRFREYLIELQHEGLELDKQDEAYYRQSAKIRTDQAKAEAKQREKEINKAFDDEKKKYQKQAMVGKAGNAVGRAENTWLSAIALETEGKDAIPAAFRAQVDEYRGKLEELIKKQEEVRNTAVPVTDAQKKAFKQQTKELADQINSVNKLTDKISGLVSEYQKLSGSNVDETKTQTTTLTNKSPLADYETQLKQYAKSITDGKAQIKSFNAETKTLTYTVKTGKNEFTEYTAAVRHLDGQLVSVQGTTKRTETFFEATARKMKELTSYFSGMAVFNQVRQELTRGIQYVREIDDALVELRKVTDETDESYDKFLRTAAKTGSVIGATISEITEATATFSKLGYDMEMATEMAESAIVYKNVGDNIASAEDAADSIISTLKGFRLESSETMRIVDRFNEVGNRFAITSQGIGEALRLSASALSEGGNSLDESIGLITAANEVVNDPSSVGTALKTLTLRLRGSKTELEEMGEDVTDMATTTSALQAKLLALTGGQVDIMLDANTFKNSTQILREMADAWEDMTDIQRASALELMGGRLLPLRIEICV